MTRARFAIGIDLGTTTCALAYVDLLDLQGGVKQLLIPQWADEGVRVDAETLPSFCYLPPKSFWKRGQLTLDLGDEQSGDLAPCDYAIGQLARERSISASDRVIHSAKSWLAHCGVDRRSSFLPWHSQEIIGSERCSPVEVSARFLRHLRRVWNVEIAQHSPAYHFDLQHIVVTIPASFDEVATRLTLEAVELAGFPLSRVRLLEEPQAGFYSWFAQSVVGVNLSEWHTCFAKFVGKQIGAPTGKILVCDIGGGTTDFSLFALGSAGVERIRVSEHILLGGDNIDLWVAGWLEKRFGQQLSVKRWGQLVNEARQLKEQVLLDDQGELATIAVTLASDGASLFAGSQSITVDCQELRELILAQFFPMVDVHDRPSRGEQGLVELGLPYAHDPAITRHLAQFLDGVEVSAVLFVGGTLQPSQLKDRLFAQLIQWQECPPIVFEQPSLVLSVSQGAALYCANLADSKKNQRAIVAGYPRSLYVQVDGRSEKGMTRVPRMICLVAKGYDFKEPLFIDIPGLKVVTGQPVAFPLYGSCTRINEQAGDLLTEGDRAGLELLTSLSSKLDLALTNGSKKSVKGTKGQHLACRLAVKVSETSLLEVACVASDSQQWQLEFDLFGAERTHADGASDLKSLENDYVACDVISKAEEVIQGVFGKARKLESNPTKPAQLGTRLEQVMGRSKADWTLGELRRLWDVLKLGETRRSRSPAHEAVWLNLAGFILRPGFGEKGDPFRMDELWQCYQRGLAFPKEGKNTVQWSIIWRRVAGGLDRERQELIFSKIFATLRQGCADPEAYLLAGALERVDNKRRVQLGNILLDQLKKTNGRYTDQKLWCLARLIARQPLYTGVETIVPARVAQEWLDRLLALPNLANRSSRMYLLCLSQGAVRAGLREFEISPVQLAKVEDAMIKLGVLPEAIAQLSAPVQLSQSQQTSLFGDSMPPGFVLYL